MSFRSVGRGPLYRPTLLRRVWRDLCSRVKGRATKCPWIYEGLPLGFKSFAEFRAYAIANGFTKRTPSPDRIEPAKGYVPGNVRFVPPKRNYATSRGRRPEYADEPEWGEAWNKFDDEVPF